MSDSAARRQEATAHAVTARPGAIRAACQPAAGGRAPRPAPGPAWTTAAAKPSPTCQPVRVLAVLLTDPLRQLRAAASPTQSEAGRGPSCDAADRGGQVLAAPTARSPRPPARIGPRQARLHARPPSGQPTPCAPQPARASAACIAVLLSALLATLAWTRPARAERAATDPPAAADPAHLCEAAAAQAARESGVPLSVLRAISLTETGRRRDGGFKPWPWTVNMEGAGVWFDGEDEARAHVFRHHQRGARSYDVGCFQINYRWHGEHFASIEEMFDPLANARYAARFLSELHAETGDWSRAAGAYHSRTREYADRYRARFDRIRARLDGAPPPEELPRLAAAEAPAAPEAEPAPVRVNNFPLLQAASPTGLGSLVPLGSAVGARLIDATGARPVAENADAG